MKRAFSGAGVCVAFVQRPSARDAERRPLGDAVGHAWERLKAGLLVAGPLGLLVATVGWPAVESQIEWALSVWS